MSNYSVILENYLIDDYASEGAIGDFFKKALEWIKEKLKNIKEKIIGLWEKITKKGSKSSSSSTAKPADSGTVADKLEDNTIPEGEKFGEKDADKTNKGYLRNKNGDSLGKKCSAYLNTLITLCTKSYDDINKAMAYIEQYAKAKRYYLTDNRDYVDDKTADEFGDFKRSLMYHEGRFDTIENYLDRYHSEEASFKNVKLLDTTKISSKLKVMIDRLTALEKNVDKSLKKFNKTHPYINNDKTVKENISNLHKNISTLLKYTTTTASLVARHCL
jgi:hypothetical protein